MPISITAFTSAHSTALFLISSSASLLSGWLYGLRRWRPAHRVQLVLAAVVLALGCLLSLVAGSALVLGFAVAVTGLAVPLIIVLCSVLAEATVHRAVLTQAFVWLSSASAAGSAAASALTGWAVDTSGPHGGFPVAALSAFALAALALAGLRMLQGN